MKRKQMQKMVLLANLLAIGIVLNIIESLYPTSPLPPQPDFAKIEDVLVGMRTEWYK